MRRQRMTLIAAAALAALCGTAQPGAAAEWKSLFDGKKLGKWQMVEKFDFIHHGKVEVKDAALVLRKGGPGTAARYTGELPKIDYEIELEGKRVEGSDFFCGMTFQVGDDALTLICGGWGGSVTGVSCIHGEPAVENETAGYLDFENGRWYKIRLRVTRKKIEAWIDKKQIVDLPTEGRKFTIWFEPETALPLGIATWETTGAIRNIRVRPIEPESE